MVNTLLLLLLLAAELPHSAPSRPAQSRSTADSPAARLEILRGECERAAAGALGPGELAALGEALFRLEAEMSDVDQSVSALKLIGSLCRSTTVEAARDLRSRALRRLVALAPKSARARVLLTEHFLPYLQRVEEASQPAELTRFDETLEQLRSVADGRTRLDLQLARCLARVNVHRTFPAAWLDVTERARVDNWLRELEGASDEGPDGAPLSTTVAELRAELRDVPFGRRIADWSAPDPDGNPVPLSRFAGKVVVLSFWSSWCVPCLELVPKEKELLSRLGPRGVALVGVNGDARVATARAAAMQHGIDWPQLHAPPDAPDALTRRLHIHQWPSVIVLDVRGAIAAKFVAGAGWTMADVEREVERLLARPNQKSPE